MLLAFHWINPFHILTTVNTRTPTHWGSINEAARPPRGLMATLIVQNQSWVILGPTPPSPPLRPISLWERMWRLPAPTQHPGALWPCFPRPWRKSWADSAEKRVIPPDQRQELLTRAQVRCSYLRHSSNYRYAWFYNSPGFMSDVMHSFIQD